MTLTFSQSQYAEDILDQFDMSTCSSSPTPMSSKPTPDPFLNLPLNVKLFPSPSLLGKLLYNANMTRPDISVVMSLLSRFMTSPTFRHWEQAKRVLCYVYGTRDCCLTFTGSISTKLLIWQDSSFPDGDDRRSRTGFISMVSGGHVSWCNKLQNNVALSTSEAEYMALAASSQKFMFLRQLHHTIGSPVVGPTTTFENNER